MLRKRLLPLLFLTVLAVSGWALYSGRLEVPERWNPWAPLRIEAAPTLVTRIKLARLSRDAPQCRAVLATARLLYAPLTDRDTGPGCGFVNAVRVSRTTAQVGQAFALSCHAAVSLAMWEHHVMQPAARRRFGEAVARIEHYGSYACRNVGSREGARRSRHATADALDIAGFVLDDGRRISVLRHWPRDNTEEAAFLRDVHRGACRFFDGVLGPEYNAAHRDHLHFDRGRFRICR
ncbi:extensin family protein [Schlegelella sp. S2-27]|uniref:Extensin family protein n=1 Tax=Caldimonas mangrovi TaxID=2944811 RepID=A0ABT0YN91_9BURK|nr:extensin family protein [Caldimonas mangrovi]MCM5679727.1 extensin family protein [Caldimonas mangrovi]